MLREREKERERERERAVELESACLFKKSVRIECADVCADGKTSSKRFGRRCFGAKETKLCDEKSDSFIGPEFFRTRIGTGFNELIRNVRWGQETQLRVAEERESSEAGFEPSSFFATVQRNEFVRTGLEVRPCDRNKNFERSSSAEFLLTMPDPSSDAAGRRTEALSRNRTRGSLAGK